ncbi:MAG: hypothetical protein ACRD1L_08545 [Terriglobales bacterium]
MMVKAVGLVMLLAAAWALSQAPATPVAVAAGTEFKIELQTKLDSKKAKAGDQVAAKVSENVKDHGVILIAKNSLLTGRVTEAAPSAGGQPAKLGVRFELATPKTGAPVPLRAAIVKVIPDAFNGSSMVSRPAEMGGSGTATQFDAGNPAYANMDRASNGTPIQYAVMETYNGAGVDLGGEITSVGGNFNLDEGAHLEVRVLH